MEFGSSSLAVSGSPASNDSLHGLKFGQKIYFEDVCNGGTGSSSAVSIAAAPTPVRKGKSQGAAHPPRCQVEGCMVDLSHAKAYYSRHKVCGMHSKSPKVVVSGLEQRFCQQCSRFHQLPEFDHGKRSCRRKLAGHNERRRKPLAASLLSRSGRLLSSFHGDNNSRPSCSALDLGYSKFLGASIKGVWPAISFGSGGNSRPVMDHHWQGGFGNTHVSMPPASPGRVQFSSSGEVLQCDEYLTGVSESSCALSLLSSQPWCTTFPVRNQPSCFNRPQMPQTVISNSYINANSWSFKDGGVNESGGSSSSSRSHVVRNVMEYNRAQFSGELEQLALQGSTHNMELDPGRCYGNSHDGIHWSL